MPLHIVIGAQWGDEGKGRVVDYFASQTPITARFNGGDNAGHTVTVGERIFKLHLIPSGIIHPHITAMMGNGMVINPKTLLAEMDDLQTAGIPVTPQRLRISYAAHLITPAHQALDKAQEATRGREPIGTTGRGIGPAYTDKAMRHGLRMVDLHSPDFTECLASHLESANHMLQSLGASPLKVSPILDEFTNYVFRISPYIADTSLELDAALKAGKTILVEGAQGTLLDLDFGTYPFVTSSSTAAPGALTGLGLGLTAAREARVTGVVKAFQTRVGRGPFPTELSGDLASRLRGSGEHPWDEYGTTTGRPRRVGWLDGVLLGYAARLNGLTDLAVTKLDILSGLESIRLCTAYQVGEQIVNTSPFCPSNLAGCEPVYEEFPGWHEDIAGVREWQHLPSAAHIYIERIAELTGVSVRLVSVGPERGQVVVR